MLESYVQVTNAEGQLHIKAQRLASRWPLVESLGVGSSFKCKALGVDFEGDSSPVISVQCLFPDSPKYEQVTLHVPAAMDQAAIATIPSAP